MNKRYVYSCFFVGCFLFLNSAFAQTQSKGISFQGVIKMPNGEFPTRSGITVNARILSPNNCILREEQFSGVNLSNGYINLAIGTGTVGGNDPGLTMKQVVDNSAPIVQGPTQPSGLVCLNIDGTVNGSVKTFNPATTNGVRKFRLSLTVDSVPLVADFNMRSMAYAIDSETLEGKSKDQFLQTTPSLTQSRLEEFITSLTSVNGNSVKWNGSNFISYNPHDASGLSAIPSSAIADLSYAKLTHVPSNLTEFSSLSCADGKLLRKVSGAWACSDESGVGSENDPTVQSYAKNAPGYGLEVNANTLRLVDSGAVAGTYSKVTVDAKGRVTTGSSLIASDIPNLDAAKIASGTITTNVNANTVNATNVTGNSVSGGLGSFNSLRIYDGVSQYITFDTTAGGTGYNLTLPNQQGAAGTVLQNNGSGVLTWVAPPSAPVSSVAGRTGAVTITTSDLSDFSTATGTVISNAKNTNNGIAGLDSSGKIPASLLPSTVSNLKSVGLSLPGIFSVTNSPLTVDGAISATLVSQTQKTVLAAPNAANGAPTFRQLQVSDLSNAGTAALHDVPVGVDASALQVVMGDDTRLANSRTPTDGSVTTAKIVDGAVTNVKITSVDWAKVSSKPTTLSGYGITDAASSSSLNNFVEKAGGTMTGALTMNAANEVRFADSSSAQYVGFKAPATVTTNQVWVLPDADGTAGQVLKTDGSGNLGWASSAAGGVTSVTSATTDIAVVSTTTTPVMTLNSGTSGGASDANKIAKLNASGVLADAMIPSLAAAKITSGQLGVANGGTGLSSGTSGGILYFSSTSTLASSALLTNNGVVLGGGAGAAPKVTAAPTAAGQVLRWGGSSWAPGVIAMTDLRSSVTGANSLSSSCADNQTLVYNSVGDVMSCANISITKSQISDFPTLATVATSGSYNDLSNKPVIPAAQVNSDWNAVSGLAQILNKPTLGTLAGKNSVDLSGSEATGVINDSRLPDSAKYWSAATGGINYAGGNVAVGTTTPAAMIDVRSPASYSAATALSGNINSAVTTIAVASTSGYPTSGVLMIDNELVSYTGVTATSFTGVTRGFSGTTAATHVAGALAETLAIYSNGNVRAGTLTSKEVRIGSAASATVIDSAGAILPGTTLDSEGDTCTKGGAIVRDVNGDIMVCSD